jgi:RecA-family ATPase
MTDATHIDWFSEVERYQREGVWDDQNGPVPIHPDTRVPPDVRAAHHVKIDPDLRDRKPRRRQNGHAAEAPAPNTAPIGDHPIIPPEMKDKLGVLDLGTEADGGSGGADAQPQTSQHQDQTPPAPFVWLDMSKWDSEPTPERRWAIYNRVPLNQAGLFSGEGGTGKSLVELYKDVAHVTGKDWYGSMPERGPAFYIGAEDPEDEIHIRLAGIAKHCDVTFEKLIAGGLHVLPLLGKDAVLCAVMGKSGRVQTTDLYKQIYEAAGDIKPKNISIDTLSRAFVGNELDRSQVYGFANHMQALAMVANGAVTILAHPSQQGTNTGTGLSGSTAWHGAFRFRQYLKGLKAENGEQPNRDIRELEFKKNQYGPTDATIVLRYDKEKGMFLPVPGVSNIENLRSDAEAEDVFLKCLDERAKQKRRVSDKTGTSYAPAIFAEMALGKPIGKEALKAAMARLFDGGKIVMGINPDVKKSRATNVILRKPVDE